MSINSLTFPSVLKLADVTQNNKKNSRYQKSKYRPVSVIPNLLKIFKNILYNQTAPYFEKIFSECQSGFQVRF